jgi:hypothetical protein
MEDDARVRGKKCQRWKMEGIRIWGADDCGGMHRGVEIKKRAARIVFPTKGIGTQRARRLKLHYNAYGNGFFWRNCIIMQFLGTDLENRKRLFFPQIRLHFIF